MRRRHITYVCFVSFALGLGGFGACVPRHGGDSASCPCTCASSGAAIASASSAPTSVVVINSATPGAATDALEVAQEKSSAGDGKGCLAALDTYDATSKHPSTDPISNAAMLRAHCLLLAGECQKGKALLAKAYEARPTMFPGPEVRDRAIEMTVVTTCRNTADLSPREQLLQAYYDLQQGAYVTQKSSSECNQSYETVKKLGPWIPPKNDDDTMVKDGGKTIYVVAPNCFARAGDCAAAKKSFDESYPKANLASVKDPAQVHEIMKQNFDSLVSKCKGTY